MKKTWVIGDIHGCLDSLLALLEKIDARGCDRIYLCGDLINRGPKSAETLEFLRTTSLPIKCILGNHDIAFIAYALGIFKNVKSDDNFQALKNDSRKEQWLDWLRRLPLYYDHEDFIIIHAGLYPHWSVQTNLEHAKELHKLFKSQNYKEHFKELWEHSNASLPGDQALSFALNVFTRMRYIKPDGSLCLKVKGLAAKENHENLKAWFEIYPPTKKTILFGHWSALRGQTDRQDIHCLDLGCVWKESLCAYRIESAEKIVQKALDKH